MNFRPAGRDLPQRCSVKGLTVALPPARGERFDDGDTMVQAAALGLGPAQVPDCMARDKLAAGRLVEVRRAWRPPAVRIHAVVPGQRLMPARVRVLLDALLPLGPDTA